MSVISFSHLLKKIWLQRKKVNNDINLVLSELTKLDAKGQAIIKKGHPEATVQVTKLIGAAYESAAEKLNGYSFAGLPEAAKKAYSEQLAGMLRGLAEKSYGFVVSSRKTVIANNVFSRTILGGTPVMLEKENNDNYRYPASVMTVMEAK